LALLIEFEARVRKVEFVEIPREIGMKRKENIF
jgi:hypothetical protein